MFWPNGSFRYERHRPETTLLYQLVERHWPEFKAMLSAQGKQLPGFVMIFTLPPHLSHFSISIAKTRLNRCAHVIE
jgi:hypothetical protein